MSVSRLFLLAVPVSLLLSGCANPHFFPRTRPLFVGFVDAHVSGEKRTALDEAKVDFLLARRGSKPQYAHYLRKEPYSMTKIYRGNGYEITIVDDDLFGRHTTGPKIVIDSEITGGDPFVYEEIDVSAG